MRGIIETSGENIGWIDTNMNEEALRFKDMEKELDDNNDLVILSRYIQGGGDNRTFLRVLALTLFGRKANMFVPTKGGSLPHMDQQ